MVSSSDMACVWVLSRYTSLSLPWSAWLVAVQIYMPIIAMVSNSQMARVWDDIKIYIPVIAMVSSI